MSDNDNKNRCAKQVAITIAVIIAIAATLITVWALWNTGGVNEEPLPIPPAPVPPVDNNDTNTNDTDTNDTRGPLIFEEICNLEPRAEVCIPALNITMTNESL